MAKIHTLPNGIRVVTDTRPGTKIVSMQVLIGRGSANEPAEENGLTNLAQEACFGGTTTRSRQDIAESIEGKGGKFASTTARATTSFSARAFSRDTGSVFAVMADVIRNPAFDPAEIRKTQEQIEQAIEQDSQHAENVARLKFFEAMYSGQPGGLSPMGQKGLVSSFTPDQIKARHAALLANPENIVISFTGDIDEATAEKLAAQYFSDLKPAAAPVPETQMKFTGGDIRESNNNNQMNIWLGFEAPSMKDDRRYAYLILQNLLSGGMSAPFFQEIREKRQLVYSVHAAYVPQRTSGFFVTVAGAGKGKVGELISTSFALIGDVLKKDFSEEELKTARERIVRNTLASEESSGVTCGGNASAVLENGRIISSEEFQEKLAQVTAEDVRRAAYEILAGDKYALAGIGPQDTMPSKDEIKALRLAQIKDVAAPAPWPKAAQHIADEFTQVSKTDGVAPGGEAKVTVLPNGLHIVTVERPGTVSCGAWVGAGADHESLKLNGATHMNEHMMFKGTPSYGPGKIDRIVEQELRGELNAYTSYDKTVYYMFNLAPDGVEKCIDICGEMVFQANIAEEEFAGRPVLNADGSIQKDKETGRDLMTNSEREVVIEEIRRANDNPERLHSNFMLSLAYAGQPHGRTILGTPEGLLALTAADLRAYRNEFYVPNNVVFAAAGPVKHEDFVALIEKKFGHLPKKEFPALYTPTYVGGTAYQPIDSLKQCKVAVLAEGVASTSPDSNVYAVFAKLLGGGDSSRMMKDIVDRKQITNDVWVGHVDFRNSGFFGVEADVRPEETKNFIQAVYENIRNLADTVTEDELNKVKVSLEMGLLSALETNQAACNAYGCEVLADGKAPSMDEIVKKIQAVTVEDIKRVARNVLASNPTVAMAGPEGVNQALIPSHDEVLALRDRKPETPGTGTAPKRQP